MQYTADILSDVWLNDGPVITGDGNVMSFHDPAGANAARSYRLRTGMQTPPITGNLILNHPYTYWPIPAYYQSVDAGDITQLTDGQTFYGGSMWVNPTTVGWSEGVNVPPQADPGPRQLPGDTYLDMLTKHADAAAIVSFVGEPRFEAAAAPSLPETRPRFICVSMADVLVRPLIHAGYVDLALAARLKPGFGAPDDSESERDFVLRFYEILQRS